MLEAQLLAPLMLRTYAYLDEASGQVSRKLKTSQTAIVVVAQDDLGRIYTLYTWAGRVRPTDIVQEVIRAHMMYHPRMFGIESNGQQNLFAQLLTELIHREGIRDFAPVYVKPPMDKTKIERIKNAIQPYMKSGRLFLRQDVHTELQREIETFPTGQTNDLIDALAGCIALIPPVMEPRKDTTTQDAIRQYLKNAGYSESELRHMPALIHTTPCTQEDPLLKITRQCFMKH
jgi:predicted phage terminase large subunit-like protein